VGKFTSDSATSFFIKPFDTTLVNWVTDWSQKILLSE